ncbi:MAG: hypothetical protein FJ257_12265 [Phycisphaerae bacterium]|nr:hypothetical protein [Phycisphaerae bacterium]
MRRSLLASSVAVVGLTIGSTDAAVFTISSPSAQGGLTTTPTSMTTGSINIGQTMGSRTSSTVDNPSGVTTALTQSLTFFGGGPMAPNSASFFSFIDAGGDGSTYFGFAYLYDNSTAGGTISVTLTTSITSNAFGVMTNIGGATTISASMTLNSSGADGFYYYMFAGVSASQVVSISGTMSNSPIAWLSWGGSSWSSNGAGLSGTGAFGLGSATQAAPIPGAGATAMLGGVAAALLGRRRSRRGH